MRYLIILIILLLSSAAAGDYDFTVPYQSKGNTEVYVPDHNYWKYVYENLEIDSTYSKYENIFWMQSEFHGISELYWSGFYVELEKNLNTRDNLYKNTYMIKYEYRPVPEPSTMVLAGISFLFMLRRRK